MRKGVCQAVVELRREYRPDGTIQHVDVKIGDTAVMIGEAVESFPLARAMLRVHLVPGGETLSLA